MTVDENRWCSRGQESWANDAIDAGAGTRLAVIWARWLLRRGRGPSRGGAVARQALCQRWRGRSGKQRCLGNVGPGAGVNAEQFGDALLLNQPPGKSTRRTWASSPADAAVDAQPLPLLIGSQLREFLWVPVSELLPFRFGELLAVSQQPELLGVLTEAC